MRKVEKVLKKLQNVPNLPKTVDGQFTGNFEVLGLQRNYNSWEISL